MYRKACFRVWDWGEHTPSAALGPGCWIHVAEHWSGLLGLQRAWCFRCLGSDCESMRNLSGANFVTCFCHLSCDIWNWGFLIHDWGREKGKYWCVCGYLPSCASLIRSHPKPLVSLHKEIFSHVPQSKLPSVQCWEWNLWTPGHFE